MQKHDFSFTGWLRANGFYLAVLVFLQTALAFLANVQARLGGRAQAQRILDQLAAASKQRYTPALSFASSAR